MIGLRSKRILTDTVIYVILAAMVVIWLFPLLWMIMRSFDSYTGATTSYVLPKIADLTIGNYKKLFTDQRYPYGSWLINTFIIAVGSCVISTLFVLMVSYALSRLRFSMRKKLMNIALVLGLFPGFLSMIALFYIFQLFGLAANEDTPELNIIGLILVYSLGAGTGYYIVKGFFDTVPAAIDEAARIDGATKNRVFWQMIIPLSKPIIIYTILTNFIGPWCDFVLAKVFMGQVGNAKWWTVAVGLQNFLSRELVNDYFTSFCAGGVLVSIPIVVLYMIMQKFYIVGITGGAAKG